MNASPAQHDGARGLWLGLLGVVIFLLMMATAFMGYVLPWGQMSFWGAKVITGLFGAIPLVGEPIQQCRRHLGVAKHTGPFGEVQVRRDHHAGVLVQFGEQVEPQF